MLPTNLWFIFNMALLLTQPGVTSRLSMRIKARRPLSPSFEISGTLLPMRMVTSANISPPSKNIGNTLTWWMTTTPKSQKSNSRLPSSLPYHHPGTISHGCILASKRVTTLILRSMPHPRSCYGY